MQWIGSGGFSAKDGTLSVELSAGNKLTWDQESFVPAGSALIFGSTSATHNVTWANDIDLNGGDRTIAVVANADNSDHAIMNGVLSNGSLTVDGDGVLELNAVNTYSGTTTVNAGATLKLKGAASISSSSGITTNGNLDLSGTTGDNSLVTLAGSGNIALGSHKLTLTNASTNFGGVLSGTGGLTVAAGTQTLSGINTYTGATTIDSGATLALTGTGSIATSSSVIDNGMFDISGTTSGAVIKTISGTGNVELGAKNLKLSNASGTFAGTIAGVGGSMTYAGGGTMTVTGNNTYTGGTSVIEHTTLIVNSDTALGDVSGPLTLDSGILKAAASFTSSRTIHILNGGKIDDSGGFAVDLTGPITLDSGMGPVTVFTGTTNVAGGWTLDAINGLVVNGLLDGIGNISQKTTINGNLSPGNSPGTMTFTAPVVISSVGTFSVDVDGTGTGTGAGNYDRVLVSGAGNTFTAGGTMVVRLRGITAPANNTFTPVVGQRFNVVHTDAGVLGSFASMTEPTTGLAAGTRFDALYSTNDIDLVATPASYADLSPLGIVDTHNRASVGGALDAYRLAPGVRMTGDMNVVLTALYSLPASDIAAPLDQIAGGVHGDAFTASLALTRLFGSITESHRNGVNMADDGDVAVAMREPLNLAKNATGGKGTPFWSRVFGVWSRAKTDGNAQSFSNAGGGIAAGIDFPRKATNRALKGYGVSAAYARSEVETINEASATVQGEQLAAYADYGLGKWRFDTELGVGLNQYKSTRVVRIGGLTRVASGEASGWNMAMSGTAHYGTGFFQPFLNARYDYVRRGAFTETGAGDLSLNVKRTSKSLPRTMAGFDMTAANAKVGANLRLAWAHDFGNISGGMDAALSGAPLATFNSRSSQVGRDAAIADVSAAARLSDSVSIFGGYQIEQRRREKSQRVSAGMRVIW